MNATQRNARNSIYKILFTQNFILQTCCTLIQCHASAASGVVWKALSHDDGIALICKQIQFIQSWNALRRTSLPVYEFFNKRQVLLQKESTWDFSSSTTCEDSGGMSIGDNTSCS